MWQQFCLLLSLIGITAFGASYEHADLLKEQIGRPDCEPVQNATSGNGVSSNCPHLVTTYDSTLQECVSLMCDVGGNGINYRPHDYPGSYPGHCNVFNCPTSDMQLTSASGGWDVYSKGQGTSPPPSPVAFYAGHTGGSGIPNQPLRFTNIFTNVGGAYAGSSGIFTAPFTGVYRFYWSIHGHTNMRMALTVNNEPVVGALHLYEFGMTGNSGIVQLTAGDQVSVWAISSFSIGSGTSSFCGHLLFTDTSGQVAFWGLRNGDMGPTSLDSTIVYTHEMLNVGNSFQWSTGVFTAPSTGVYEFYWAITSLHTMTIAEVNLDVNGSPVLGTIDGYAPHPTIADNMALLRLTAGDTVTLTLKSGRTAGSGPNGYDTYTSFSGRRVSSGPVAFLAARTDTYYRPEEAGVMTLTYDDLILNEGSSYNVLDGHFTAPQAGIYRFFYSSRTDGPHGLRINLMRNGQRFSHCLTTNDGGVGTRMQSNSAILELQAGERISTLLQHNCTVGGAIGGVSFTAFSGSLL